MAETQKRLASALELSNQAELLGSQQPAEIELATLLATESARRLESVEAQQALERTLGVLTSFHPLALRVRPARI
jgi:hypothetical protein